MSPRRHLYLRWFLLLAGVATAVLGVTTTRVATGAGDLKEAIAAGRLDSVQLVDRFRQPYIGFSTVEVRWRDGLRGRTTQVWEVHCRDGTTTCPAARQAGKPRYTDVAAGLRALDPDLRVEDVRGDDLRTGPTASSANTLALVLILGVCFALVLGPEPRLATRWAWFWLIGIGVGLGAFAYLLLSGPLRPSRLERSEDAAGTPPSGGRLTGGWAFLISVCFGSAITTVVRGGLVG